MPDYEKMYHALFNAITDALAAMENQDPGTAVRLLKQAQIHCEELYISATDK